MYKEVEHEKLEAERLLVTRQVGFVRGVWLFVFTDHEALTTFDESLTTFEDVGLDQRYL